MIRRTGGGEYASRRRPNCSGVSGQYVRMLRSDRASAGNDGVGRAESRPSRIGPINLDVKQMGERNAGCVKKTSNRHAVREMKEGPSGPPCRGRPQAATSCFSQKLR